VTVLLNAMMMYQEGASAPQASPFGLLLPFVLIFAVFYFLIIRPQSKRQKDHQAMVKALQKGDQIVTAGGFHGTIQAISDESEVVTVEIADKVRVKISRGSISKVVENK
jgi:preprotein translocase subunit YajC